jgi:hypothetical protein
MNAKLLCRAGVVVVAARLVLASIVVAQIVDVDPPEPPVAPRVEIGPAAGGLGPFPELGVVASVPASGGVAVEATLTRMPSVLGAPARSLVQLQLRAPFRDRLLSRKSLTVGVTRIATEGRRGFLGGDHGDFVRPHAGVSLQWPVARSLDFRFDAQGIFTFVGELPMVPRAMTAFVWHPASGGSR